MGQPHPLPKTTTPSKTPLTVMPAPAEQVEAARCELCGARFGPRALRRHLVSPQSSQKITVCHTCHQAALGEGYRPAE